MPDKFEWHSVCKMCLAVLSEFFCSHLHVTCMADVEHVNTRSKFLSKTDQAAV